MKTLSNIVNRDFTKGDRRSCVQYDSDERAFDELKKTLTAPDSSHNPWNQISLGKTSDAEEMVWDLRKQSNLTVVGQPGSGKSMPKHVIIEHCNNHYSTWEVLILDFVNGRDFKVANSKTTNLIDQKFDAVQAIQGLYSLFKARAEGTNDNDKKVMVVIPNFSTFRNSMIDKKYSKGQEFAYTSGSLVDGEEIMNLLDLLFTLGGEHGIHFCVEDVEQENLSEPMKKHETFNATKLVRFGNAIFKTYDIRYEGVGFGMCIEPTGLGAFTVEYRMNIFKTYATKQIILENS